MPTAVLEEQQTKKMQEQKRAYSAPIALYENDESYIVIVELPGAEEHD